MTHILFLVALALLPFTTGFLGALRPLQKLYCVKLSAKRKGVSLKRAPSFEGKKMAEFITVEDFFSDSWKLASAVDVLRQGGVAVIPTDTCYSFITPVSSRKGVERLMKLKGGGKKPLSILCKDLSMIDLFTDSTSREKWVFKLLKSTLPGPYTYIMPSSSALPKMIVDRKHHKLNKWRRKEIGIRMPSDAVCRAIMGALGEPLLSGSVPEAGEDQQGLVFTGYGEQQGLEEEGGEDWEDEDVTISYSYEDIDFSDTSYIELSNTEALQWAKLVDIVVLNGPRGGADTELSTVVDLTRSTDQKPLIVRQGKGVIDDSVLL